jgi:Zn-dependent peptidase ImmA (M78 family)
MGLEHRQTLAAIEAGERRLGADELLRAMEILRVDLDYFTDSFRLVGAEGRFSFRAQRDILPALLDAFEERAGRWIALYRELEAEQGEQPHWLEHKLALTPRSSFEDAQSAAEALAEGWSLGPCPAERLATAMEKHLRVLVLHVRAKGISGAALQVPGLNAVLVNRDEPEGRRSFDLAHELFHILTWDAMPPERVESIEVPHGGKGRRIEQLAESFAAALLMPAAVLRARWNQRRPSSDLHDWVNRTASELRVSALACKWRLVNLGLLSKGDLLAIDDKRLVAKGRAGAPVSPVPLFSATFVRRVAVALESGHLSVKRAAGLLDLSLAELAELLRGYGLEPSFEP